MSTWKIFWRAFSAASKETQHKPWITRLAVGIVTSIIAFILTKGGAFSLVPVAAGILAVLICWFVQVLISMVTKYPLRLQREVEELRISKSDQEKVLRMEMVARLRCEYQMDHPDAPKNGIPKDWIVSRLFRIGEKWDPDEYSRMLGIKVVVCETLPLPGIANKKRKP